MILSARNITKSFVEPTEFIVLKSISLELMRGQSIAIQGRSGEGKSTLLQILGTLDKPTSGELFLLGKKVSDDETADLRNRHVGFVFQAFHLFDDETVLNNVLLPASIAKEPIHKRSPHYERALYLLNEVGLSHRLHFETRLLSGGEKQRVSIARALIMDPEILLADEPTGNLDLKNANLIVDLLLQIVKKEKKAFVLATHSESFAFHCDERYELKEGLLTLKS